MKKLLQKLGLNIESKKSLFTVLVVIFFLGTIIQNIMEVYLVGDGLTIRGEMICWFGGGLLISWLVFGVMDIITEIYGKNTSVKVFSLAILTNLLFIGLLNLLMVFPESTSAGGIGTTTLTNLAGSGIRLVASSAIAFWTGNFINATIMSKLKHKHGDEKYIHRSIVSTIFGQLIDNMIFNILAFGPFGLVFLGFGTFEFGLTWGESGPISQNIFNGWLVLLISVLISTSLEVIIEAIFSPLNKLISTKAKNLK